MTLATLARTYLAEPKPCSRAALTALPIVTRADALKSVRFHGLRHSHLSMLLKSGVPVHAVAARTGHARASTTLDNYAHLLGGENGRAAGVADEILPRALK